MEGFYTVHFQGVQGFGYGVVTLVGGEVFGGDSGYLYVGSYTDNGNAFAARVHVKQYAPGTLNVMGKTEFDLDLGGSIPADTTKISLAGSIPGTALKLTASLTKLKDIKVR